MSQEDSIDYREVDMTKGVYTHKSHYTKIAKKEKAIMALVASGNGINKTARDMGVSKNTVMAIVAGKLVVKKNKVIYPKESEQQAAARSIPHSWEIIELPVPVPLVVHVQCSKTSCGASEFCSHAVPHLERENCYPSGFVRLYGALVGCKCPKCEVVK